MNVTLPYIPTDYAERRTTRVRVWHHPSLTQPEAWEAHIDDVLARVEQCLDFTLACRLHVVVYATSAEAHTFLDRAVPDNMLLAPLQGSEDSLIAVQSARVNAVNGDLKRMQRMLAHELAHVAVALRTDSSKRLGDNDVNLRVAPWVNEGFAVSVTALVTAQLEAIRRALQAAPSSWRRQGELDSALNDLSSARRAAAFDTATAVVWRAIEAHGLRFVFEHLEEPRRWAPFN